MFALLVGHIGTYKYIHSNSSGLLKPLPDEGQTKNRFVAVFFFFFILF